MKLFIIIVSFDGGKTLDRLISDLVKEDEVKIVVVDNGSDRKSGIKNYEARIKLIKNKKNLGFARAANIGIKYAVQNNADRVLLLNQDVTAEPGFIQTLVDNNADITSPVIKFKRDNKWVYDLGGKVNWWMGRTYHIESNNQHIDYVSGCAMMIKRQVFEKIGFFDERFFLYFEDADFCLRARKAGFTITVEPESVITHELIEGKERSIFKIYHLLRSNFIFINKYLGVRGILGYLYLLLLAVKITLDRFLHHPRSPSATSEVS